MRRLVGIILLILALLGRLPFRIEAQAPFVETYRSVDGTLSLQYPAGWIFKEGGGQIFASNHDPDTLYDNGHLLPGNVSLVIVTPFYTHLLLADGMADAGKAVANLGNLLALPEGTTIGTPEATTIGDFAASVLQIDTPDRAIVVAVVRLAEDVQVVAVWFTVPSELADFQPVVLDMVASMTYTPPPAPIELGEMVWQVQRRAYTPEEAISFGSPGPVTVGPDDTIYLAVHYGEQLSAYSPDGEFGREIALPDGMAISDMAIMADGSLWIADAQGGQSGDGAVSHLSATGEILSAFELAQPDVPVVKAPDRPLRIALGPDGLIYVGYLIEPLDSGYRDIKIRVVDGAGQLVHEFMVAMDVPQLDDMAIGPDGNLYLLVAGRLQVFDLQGNLLRQPELLLPGVPWYLDVGLDGTLYMYLAGAAVVVLANDGTYRGQFGHQQSLDNAASEIGPDELRFVMGMAVLSNGDVVLTDTNFNFARLVRISIQ